MEVAEASARACKRRVTDGINHRCDRVRGGERGRRAVTDGAECRCWRRVAEVVVAVGFRARLGSGSEEVTDGKKCD